MRKIDAARHELRRQEILQAAGRCFLRNGFRGASVSDICKEAEMSAGHLYHYFPTKEAIIEALAVSALTEAPRNLEALFGRGLKTGAFFEAGGLPPASQNEGQSLLLEILVEAGRNEAMGAIVRAHSAKVRDVISSALQQAKDLGDLAPSVDPATTADVFMILFDGIKATAIRNPDFDRSRGAELLNRLLSPLFAGEVPKKPR